MTTKNDGGPAFPVFPETGAGHAAAHQGLSLRNYFAAKAMQGLVATNAEFSMSFDQIAKCAYKHADAMLEAMK